MYNILSGIIPAHRVSQSYSVPLLSALKCQCCVAAVTVTKRVLKVHID